ncbi:unnamed protein product [Withania somnifera]
MLDVLSEKHPSSRPASTRVNSHQQLPFLKPLGYFPPMGGIPLTDTNSSSTYGSSLMGKAQGIYVASSEEGNSHMMAMTITFLGNEYEDSLSFFGVHWGDVFESHIAVIGGTGKYHDANGYATLKIINATSNKSEGAYKILSSMFILVKVSNLLE